MKHLTYFMLIAAVVLGMSLSSCSKVESETINPNKGITFSTSLLRANSVGLNELNSFKVSAFNNAQDANYFTDLEVSKSGAEWTYSPLYYWPSYELTFMAYAPTTLTGITIDKTTQKLTDYTVKQKLAEQEDVLVAVNKGTEATLGASCVLMNFRHAMSQIRVKAKNSNKEAYNIEVKGVKLAKVPSKGTFAFPTDVTTAHNDGSTTDLLDFATSWTMDATPVNQSYMSKKTAGVMLTETPQSLMGDDENFFIMIPQQLNTWKFDDTKGVDEEAHGAYISVLLKISTVSGAKIYPTAGDQYAFAAIPINTKWEPGKRYTYILDFLKEDPNVGGVGNQNGGGAGFVDPDPTNPDNTSDPDIAQNPTTKKKGDPILGPKICFTVNVDSWVEVTPELPINM